MKDEDHRPLMLIAALLLVLIGFNAFQGIRIANFLALVSLSGSLGIIAVLFFFRQYSSWGKARKKRLELLRQVPHSLLTTNVESIHMGMENELGVPIYLPDKIRTRHIHVIGATGSGKTESVILNFLRQDCARGLGAIILDAKADASFLADLQSSVPPELLQVFDLTTVDSLGYNPLADGSALESAQRLFSSFIWSEEYYKSKALTALQRLFTRHQELNSANPKLTELEGYLKNPAVYISFTAAPDFPKSLALKEYEEISGLRDQLKSLTMAHLATTLSPAADAGLNLKDAARGAVIYFRLQSLMSPQLVGTLGRLIINHLSFIAGTAHRDGTSSTERHLIPVYLDEFATFACPEFADLISKARSAGFALHFSHQSIGDLVEVSEGFLSRITDNSATKIVMRVNDPDSAEYFARAFGTRLYQKATQRVTNAKNLDSAELLEEGTVREAHQFRASPDRMKTLPTGQAVVLIAHGEDFGEGGSNVFELTFPVNPN
jgi:type IV secretory pathway TraG/TraD family ATPase VirD4